MAKNRKYVKLGEKASLFFDPTSKTKVTPGTAVELSNTAKMSKRVIKAIKSGHLDYVADNELEDLTVKSLRKDATTKKVEKKDEVDAEVEYTEKSLMKLKKSALIDLAKENFTEYDDEELEGMTKDELTEEILALNEEEEDEEDNQ